MNFKIFSLMLLLFLFNINNGVSQNIFTSKTNQQIWEAKDRNDFVFTKEILKNGNIDEKILALKGLQSWHDSALRKPLSKLAKCGNPPVRIAAIEAIGQSRDSFYIPYLCKLINKRKFKNEKPQALVALGKCITKSKVGLLLKIKDTRQPGYAECIYRAMLKGVGEKSLTDKMAGLINDKNKENEFYAAWYLSRTPFVITSDNFRLIYERLMKSSDYLKCPTDISVPLLIALGKSKCDARDSLLIRKIFSLPYSESPGFIGKSQDAISVFRAIIINKYKYDSNTVNMMNLKLDEKALPALQLSYSELISKNCKAFEKSPELSYGPAIVNFIKNAECNTGNVKLPVTNSIFDKIWNLQLLENKNYNYPLINNILMHTDEPAVKSAAMESLIKCRNLKGFPDNLKSDFNETVAILIKDGDEGVLSIIANAILDKQIPVEPNYRNLLIEAQSGLKLPVEMEAYIDIAKVLAMIDNAVYKRPDPEWNHPIDWAYAARIKPDQKIKVTTNKGEFIIKLNVNAAPGSVASILKLIDEGFYNGKFFHRMVPNFVLQGGCPRGDGFGGVNYTIRSEFSSLKYSTGAVGLASSGPDTESCQWFVTHCPTPHLDGRYTVIGYVIEGMETIHKLGVGDTMNTVEKNGD